MTRNDCEFTRDLLPLVHRAECTGQEAAAVAEHLAGCAECRQEQQLVGLIASLMEPVPAGLEQRVSATVRRRGQRRWLPAAAALAATVAAAVIGGTLAMEWLAAPQSRPAAVVLDDGARPAVSWAVTDDALLHSGITLQELSVEELEMVLAELDS